MKTSIKIWSDSKKLPHAIIYRGNEKVKLNNLSADERKTLLNAMSSIYGLLERFTPVTCSHCKREYEVSESDAEMANIFCCVACEHGY